MYIVSSNPGHGQKLNVVDTLTNFLFCPNEQYQDCIFFLMILFLSSTSILNRMDSPYSVPEDNELLAQKQYPKVWFCLDRIHPVDESAPYSGRLIQWGDLQGGSEFEAIATSDPTM